VSKLIDVALILGLTYGIYRKSRVCALLMLVYFLISKLIMIEHDSKGSGLVMAVIFLYYYVQGVLGTFAYHKHIRVAPAKRPESLDRR
jgi:serine/threonine-protein kinase